MGECPVYPTLILRAVVLQVKAVVLDPGSNYSTEGALGKDDVANLIQVRVGDDQNEVTVLCQVSTLCKTREGRRPLKSPENTMSPQAPCVLPLSFKSLVFGHDCGVEHSRCSLNTRQWHQPIHCGSHRSYHQ